MRSPSSLPTPGPPSMTRTLHAPVAGAGRHAYDAAGGRVADGVLEEVAEEPLEIAHVAAHGERRLGDLEAYVALDGRALHRPRRAREQVLHGDSTPPARPRRR